MLSRELRLTRTADFALVAKEGRPVASPHLSLRARRSGRPAPRFGLSVSRAVGCAVARNLVKRRLRELLRRRRVAPGWDVVISARRGAAEAGFGELEREVDVLLRRARLLHGQETLPGNGPR